MKDHKNINYQGSPGGSDSFGVTCSSIISGVITFFLLLIAAVFPLIYHDSYFDILETKYRCYYLLILGMMAVCLILALVMAFVDVKEYQAKHVKGLVGSLSPKNWKMADVFVLVYWLVAAISTLQSDYVYESFWGNEGRYTGLFLVTLYVASYFLISKCWKVRGWMLDVFLISGMVMCLIGITDYFQMDILKFRVAIKPEQSTLFTSTVGNINTYTAYVAMVMGFAAAMFGTAKSVGRTIWYYICLVVSFFAIIMGCSDNAYLALGVLFAFLPFILFRSWSGLLRYLMVAASFFTVTQCIDWINAAYGDVVIGLDSLFRVIAGFGGLPVVVLALWLLVAVVYVAGRSRGVFGKAAKWSVDGAARPENPAAGDLGKVPVLAWGIFIAVCVLGVCAALFDANVAGNGSRYGSLGYYLVFNDSWGTNRGYIWRKGLELYQDFPAMHKLFGFGPDTFGILTTKEIRHDMVQATGQVFDNVHNEYLNLLITIGPIGMAAYVGFIVAALARLCKKMNLHVCVFGCAVAVLCYSAQAAVNLNLPIATPMMWFLVSVGMAGCREYK